MFSNALTAFPSKRTLQNKAWSTLFSNCMKYWIQLLNFFLSNGIWIFLTYELLKTRVFTAYKTKHSLSLLKIQLKNAEAFQSDFWRRMMTQNKQQTQYVAGSRASLLLFYHILWGHKLPEWIELSCFCFFKRQIIVTSSEIQFCSYVRKKQWRWKYIL